MALYDGKFAFLQNNKRTVASLQNNETKSFSSISWENNVGGFLCNRISWLSIAGFMSDFDRFEFYADS